MLKIIRAVHDKVRRQPEGAPSAHPRRTFLKETLLALCAGWSVSITASASTSKPPAWLMIVDRNRCIGCRSCVVGCKAQSRSTNMRFNTHVHESESDTRTLFESTLCNHCEPAPCVAACPQKATTKTESGIVVNDWNRCTADGACVSACPYGARYLDPRFGDRVDKCDFCIDRLAKGLSPACVETCPPRARLFGDPTAPCGDFAKYIGRNDLTPARPEVGLKTRVLYVPLHDRGGNR